MNYWDTEEWKAANRARANAYAAFWATARATADTNPHQAGTQAWTDHQRAGCATARADFINADDALHALEVELFSLQYEGRHL